MACNNVTNNSTEYLQEQMQYLYATRYAGNTIGSLAVILNIVFLACMRHTKNGQCIFNSFIKTLTVCDILGSLFFMITQNYSQGPFAGIHTNHSQNGVKYIWIHGSPYVFRSIPWMFFTGYIFTLNCLTINQYLASCRPHFYTRIQTGRNVRATLIIVWILSSFQIIIPLFILAYVSTLEISEAFSRLISLSNTEMIVWMTVYAGSSCFSIALNILVYLQLHKRKQKRCVSNNTDSIIITSSSSSNSIQATNKAIITIMWLCLANILFRLPFPLLSIAFITVIRENYGILATRWVSVSASLLLYIVFFVDPVIYFVRITEVRNIFSSRIIGVFRLRDSNNKESTRIDFIGLSTSPGERTIGVQTSFL